MKNIPSAEFRKIYPRLPEPVAVTVLGRVIGHYVPVGTAIDDRFVAGLRPGEPPEIRAEDSLVPKISPQTQRDAILRRINKG